MILVASVLVIAIGVAMFVLHEARAITFPWERGKRG